jgi:sugar phosphate isomerase/epimerase
VLKALFSIASRVACDYLRAMNTLSRRGFLHRSLAGSIAVAGGCLAAPGARAIQPIERPGRPRLPLSLAAYSFRDFFPHMRGKVNAKAPADRQMDMFQFIDYCADQGIPGAELTSYFFPPDLTDEYLLRVRRHAFLRGVTVSGTAVGNNFARPKGEELDREIADTKLWIDRAALLSAPHIRVFAGSPPKGTDAAEAKRNCLAALEECCDYAGKKGIFLGLENHGGIVAGVDDMLDIVRAVNHPWFGVNLDTGNFHSDDPYGDLERCAPYAVNVQVKIEMKPKGKGAEPADLPRLIQMLRKVNYQGFVVLEYESKDPWKEVPEYLKQLKELCA